MGKDIAGACQVADLTKMPHLLIAGSTGSGKSVCINAIIMSFLYKSSPEDLKLIMIDPKVVELAEYNGIPHLLMPVVTEPRKAAGALGAAVARNGKALPPVRGEQRARHQELQRAWPQRPEGMEKLPYIAIVIDELADLMMVAGKEVEDYICRIAQKARAAGMHLIVATQRPSVDVITGLIKANIPSRIAFAVIQPDRQPHHSGRGRRGKAAGHGRHALHACRREQARPRSRAAYVQRRGDQRRVELHQKALFTLSYSEADDRRRWTSARLP